MEESLADRLARLEERVDRLEGGSGPVRVSATELDAGTFWALEGLKDRVADPGAGGRASRSPSAATPETHPSRTCTSS